MNWNRLQLRQWRNAMEVQKMNNWKPVNRNQLESLFAENACLFGNVDGIPIETAKTLFGGDAIDFATRMNNSSGRITRNGYGSGLTQRGGNPSIVLSWRPLKRAQNGL